MVAMENAICALVSQLQGVVQGGGPVQICTPPAPIVVEQEAVRPPLPTQEPPLQTEVSLDGDTDIDPPEDIQDKPAPSEREEEDPDLPELLKLTDVQRLCREELGTEALPLAPPQPSQHRHWA